VDRLKILEMQLIAFHIGYFISRFGGISVVGIFVRHVFAGQLRYRGAEIPDKLN
jgi:hypothetical protein